MVFLSSFTSVVILIFVVLDAYLRCSFFISGACVNEHKNCSIWANIGECKKNPKWMLHKCQLSCKVCSGQIVCVNTYNDQYCDSMAQSGNCWRPDTVDDLLKHCAKSCVCSCCSAVPPTTPTKTVSTVITVETSTKLQTTTTSRTLGNITSEPWTKSPESVGQTPVLSTGTKTAMKTIYGAFNANEKNLSTTQKNSLNVVMVAAIVVGTAVLVGVSGFVGFCFWRKKRMRSSNESKGSSPITENKKGKSSDDVICLENQSRSTDPTSVTIHNDNRADRCINQGFKREHTSRYSEMSESESSSSETPFYHVLERPALDVPKTDYDEPSSVGFHSSTDRVRPDSDYDEPLDQEARVVIGLRKNVNGEVVYEDPSPKHDNYPCGFTKGRKDLTLECEKTGTYEALGKHPGPLYLVLESPAGEEIPLYQSPEISPSVTMNHDLTRWTGCPSDREQNESCSYQALSRSVQSFYQPLKKTVEVLPRRTFTRK